MPEPVEGTFSILISVPERSRRHIISIALKIRVLSRTSMMFLWELKNAIISQNLRGLCVIKANTNIPHIVASTSSATNSFITRCLSLSKAVLIPPYDFDSAQSPYYLLLLSVPEPVEGTFSLLISVPEPVEGTIISIVLKYVCFLEHL